MDLKLLGKVRDGVLGIYMIYNILNNKMYIGSGRIRSRLIGHKNKLRSGKHENQHLQNSWDKYGEIVFLFVPVEIVSDESLLDIREQFWMDSLNSYDRKCGYNIQKRADRKNISYLSRQKIKETNIGRKHTPESLEKIRANCLKGKNHPQYGKKLSDETKRRISAKLKGEKHPFFGKKLPKEFCEKVSKGKTGKTHKPGYTRPVIQLSLKGEVLQLFSSSVEAGRFLNADPGNIRKACKNSNNIVKGYKWSYATSEVNFT